MNARNAENNRTLRRGARSPARGATATALALLLATTAAAATGRPPVEVTIRALPDQMRYDRTEFRVLAGDRVRLTFRNDDFMPHNVVICRPREAVTPGAPEDNGMEVAVAAWALGESATALEWVPPHPRVLAATRILDGQASDVIEFTAPEQPGRHPYVCTFPGHAVSMQGAMQVQARVEGLRDLRYRVFAGSFDAMPEFPPPNAEAVADGLLPDGLIDAAVGAPRESFAVEFEGVLRIPRQGRYTFAVAGDNGPRLLIDGQVVLDHGGATSAGSVGTASVVLTPGGHRLVLQYWHRRERRKPQPEVTLLWSSADFKELPLSRVDLVARRRQQDVELATGIPLGPENGEPAFYRNFIAGVLPSGFGVGYPGGANLTWDPVRMNVGALWAGAFLDVKKHRTLRGGVIGPLGYAVIEPAAGPPLAVMTDPDMPWPAGSPADAYRFSGYTFDPRRRPTFRYRFRGIDVADRFDPEGSAPAGDMRLRRTLEFSAGAEAAPGDLVFRVLQGRAIDLQPHGYVLPAGVTVTTPDRAIVRQAGAVREVLLPVEFSRGRARLEITYAWDTAHPH